MNDFDLIAKPYDFIKRLVFNQRLDEITKAQFHLIPPDSKILILGGGTGALLNELVNGEITYLEKSKKMIERAKGRGCKNVKFVQLDFVDYQSLQKYDVIICPFFLDVFSIYSLEEVLKKVRQLLKDTGFLLVIDFQPGKRSHHLLTKLMIFFFSIFAQLESEKLINIDAYVQSAGFILVEEVIHFEGFLFSRLYRI